MTERKRYPIGYRIHRWGEVPINGPAWRYVLFEVEYSSGKRVLAHFVFPNLKMANNARIIARAMYNWSVQCKEEGYKVKPNWSSFARHLDWIHYTKNGRERASIGDAVSAKLYGNIQRGTLPKDERVRQMIFDLAGYPWE